MLQLFQILRDRGSISQQEFDLLNNLTSNGPTTAATIGHAHHTRR